MENEKRLIDLDEAIDALGVEDKDIYCKHFLEERTTVDAVEVVRCKDCKHYEIHKPKVLENCERSGHLIPMKPDDFCSCGERREGE